MFWTALTMILIALIQLPALINGKRWPELAGFGVTWFAATLYALLIAANIPIPNPIELLYAFYSWLFPLIGVNF